MPVPHESLDEARIVIRPYDTQTDQGFLYSSWRNGLYYHTEPRHKGNPDEFFRQASKQIKRILRYAKVTIACLSDSPIVIVGYCVMTGAHLNWIYVKEDYRKKGIGRLLCNPNDLETVTSDVTRLGVVLLEKYQIKTLKEEPGE